MRKFLVQRNIDRPDLLSIVFCGHSDTVIIILDDFLSTESELSFLDFSDIEPFQHFQYGLLCLSSNSEQQVVDVACQTDDVLVTVVEREQCWKYTV